MVVTVILSVRPVGDTEVFLPISAVDEFSHRSSREFRCLSKAIKPEIFNTDMFLFLLEKSPQPFNSPWRLPLSNRHSFYRQKGSLPLKAAFLERPCAHCVISLCLCLSFDLTAFHPAAGKDSSREHPENGVCLAQVAPHPATAGPSLSKHPWCGQGRGSPQSLC